VSSVLGMRCPRMASYSASWAETKGQDHDAPAARRARLWDLAAQLDLTAERAIGQSSALAPARTQYRKECSIECLTTDRVWSDRYRAGVRRRLGPTRPELLGC
jgi:hypothetical protein